ncbi:hypothetical protein D6833_07085 [Candidatus Parcubacteria bacterium]|nr:MAG: hypothetical protein D6833_07085 [Candidatus Parcubacteria bacterium]
MRGKGVNFRFATAGRYITIIVRFDNCLMNNSALISAVESCIPTEPAIRDTTIFGAKYCQNLTTVPANFARIFLARWFSWEGTRVAKRSCQGVNLFFCFAPYGGGY